MSKGLKIGLGIGVLLLIIAVLYYVLKGSAKFSEYPQKDIGEGAISDESGVTLAQAKANAVKLNAASFVYYPDTQRAFYKSKSGPILNGWNPGTYTLYVKQ